MEWKCAVEGKYTFDDAVEKFGKVDDYSDYNKVRTENTIPAIYHYSPKYFMDPEENLVEVYLDTPWYVAQPHGDPDAPAR